MPNLSSFYRGKRVLVTGHTSFFGGWLTAWLKLMGGNVIGFALPPRSRPNLFDVTILDRNIISIFGDVRDRDALTAAFVHQQPEIVIHLAGQAAAKYAQTAPVETCSTNVMGTVHVLEEARYARSLRAVLVVTIEERAEKDPSEDDLYASTMACARTVTAAYREKFFHQPGSAAIGCAQVVSAIGGGDWEEGGVVPAVAHAISAGETVSINNADCLHTWQHVLDPIRGCLLAAQLLYERGTGNESSWRFAATGVPVSVQEIATRMVSLWHEDVLVTPESSWGPPTRSQSGSRHTEDPAEFAWHAALDLDQTLAWTVEWYRSFYQNAALAWPITEAQIRRFAQLAEE